MHFEMIRDWRISPKGQFDLKSQKSLEIRAAAARGCVLRHVCRIDVRLPEETVAPGTVCRYKQDDVRC